MSALPLAVTTPDTVVYVVVGFFALRGAIKGVVWQVLRTAGLFAGLLLAATHDVAVGTFLTDRFRFLPQTSPQIVGWIVIVVGTFLVVSLLAHLVRGWVRDHELSGVDRALGLVFGALFGLGVAAIGFTMWASTRPSSEVRETLAGSSTTRHMAQLVQTVKPLFPDGVRTRWSTVFDSLADAR